MQVVKVLEELRMVFHDSGVLAVWMDHTDYFQIGDYSKTI